MTASEQIMAEKRLQQLQGVANFPTVLCLLYKKKGEGVCFLHENELKKEIFWPKILIR